MNGTMPARPGITRRSAVHAVGLAALPALAAACGAAGTAGTTLDAMPKTPVSVQLWANGPSEPAVNAQIAGWAQKQPTVRLELSYGKEVFDIKGTEALVALMAG